MNSPNAEMMKALLLNLAAAQESQASAAVRARVREFRAFADPGAMYDCLVAACELNKYYSRPGVDDRDEKEQACVDSMRKSGGMELKRSE